MGPVNPITKEERYTYDGRGNLLRTEYVNGNDILPNDQYSYSGNRLVSRSRVYYDPQPVVLSTVPFTHDALGRMTHDGTSNLDITYNYLDMPEKISRNDTLLVKYLYLSDGMKTGARNSSGQGLEYRGTMTFRRDAQGALTFESVPFVAGRMTGDGVRYYVTDHLGSIRAVLDGDTGNLLEASDYSAFGIRRQPQLPSLLTNQLNNSTPSMPFRHHFTGQEEQVGLAAPGTGTATLSLPYTDFGARHYSPTLSRWLVPDPLSEKYYDVSPYAYCANDPVNLVDPDGTHTRVSDNGDGTYEVIGGELDDDLNVYVYTKDSNGAYTIRGDSIGRTAFQMSFYNSDTEKWAKGAIIDLHDSSGVDFLNEIAENKPGFLSYMFNAQNGKLYDFKETNGIPGGSGYNPYRGMMMGDSIVSARDVGNIAAGYVSGISAISYSTMRRLFDGYQSFSDSMAKSVERWIENPYNDVPIVVFSREGPSSTIPQKFGWCMGVLSRIQTQIQ